VADLGIGEISGIVALAALVVKESFGFVLRPKNPQVELDWGRIAQMMHVAVAPLEAKIDSHSKLLESKLELDREHNTMFRDFLQRTRGREEGREEGHAQGIIEGREIERRHRERRS
jgi:hypothetical protein